MREIKFRGKRIDTGEWIYGYFTRNDENGNCYITTQTESGGAHPWQVIPETVGQFTGVSDKNGKEIYDRDVLQMFRHSDNTNRHEKDFVSKVSFEFGTFYVLGRYATKQSFLHMARPGQSFEIIGNIHDNPELIHDQKAEVEHD
jgi:uncharacterized phage protein (TIGR01671 family)